MLLTQIPTPAIYSIRSYAPGSISIYSPDHTEHFYTQSLILSPNTVIENWPPNDPESLSLNHLQALIALKPEVILIGTGEQHIFLSPAVFAEVIEKSIGFEVMSTSSACHTFNLLVSEGRNVVAGLILSSS